MVEADGTTETEADTTAAATAAGTTAGTTAGGDRNQSTTGDQKTVFVPQRGGGYKKAAIRYPEDDRDFQGGYDDSQEGYDGHDEYPFGRVIELPRDEPIVVSDMSANRERVEVKITPAGAAYKTKVRWTPDSGAPKTMLAGKHFGWILAKNPETRLHRTNVRFRPYSTADVVPLLGVCEMTLSNEEGKAIKTDVYIVDGEQESLLGKQDAIDLGIIKLNPRGDKPDKSNNRLQVISPEFMGCITPEILDDQVKDGVVSGGQTQAQISTLR